MLVRMKIITNVVYLWSTNAATNPSSQSFLLLDTDNILVDCPGHAAVYGSGDSTGAVLLLRHTL